MKNNTFLFIVLLLIAFTQVNAQLNTSADFKRSVYDREYTVGLSGHSKGYTINGRYLKHTDGYTKRGFELDLAKLRHPKEVRSNSISQNSRGFVFGRTNSLYTMRAGYIQEKVLFDKTDQGTVSISLVTSGGLSLGLLKPVYLVGFEQDEQGSQIPANVRYNRLGIESSNPGGEANWFTGLFETKLRPGIYSKVGVAFDYDFLDDKVTSLETGVIYDFFFADVPIFLESNGSDNNMPGFFQVYIQFNFGYKKN